MSLSPERSLLAFCGLAAGTVGAMFLFRVVKILQGSARMNSFPSGADHGGPAWYKRVLRAHHNIVENLPIFASLVLLRRALGGADGVDWPFWCTTIVAARLGQIAAHVASGGEKAVVARASFFGVQYLGFGLLAADLWARAGA